MTLFIWLIRKYQKLRKFEGKDFVWYSAIEYSAVITNFSKVLIDSAIKSTVSSSFSNLPRES